MMFCVIIILLIATTGAILTPAIQPIRTFCPSQNDVNSNNSCISEFNNLDRYSQVFQSADPNRVSRNLTINSMGLTTAHFLPETVNTVCIENGSSPIDNLTNSLSLQLQSLSSNLHHVTSKSCLDIKNKNGSAVSGYYFITTNGTLSLVYCDMEGNTCGGAGGWTRVAFINMSNPSEECPSALRRHVYPNVNHSVCGRPKPSGAGCNSMSFSSYDINYTRVCGRIRGYQFCSNDAFYPNVGGSADINGLYVDGYSITYGIPRQHIWSYAGGLEQRLKFGIMEFLCPCNQGVTRTPPVFVGNDYYCESALPIGQGWKGVLYADDPLWDGEQCIGDEGSCCTNPNLPWFLKSLGVTTNSDIEVRLCGSQHTDDEDTPFDLLELFIR